MSNQESNVDIEVTLDKLFKCVIEKLKDRLRFYDEEDARNMQILRTFHVHQICSDISNELFIEDDVSDFDTAYQIEKEKLTKQSHKLTVAQLEKYLNSFKTIKTFLEEYSNNIQRELIKYENEYLRESENTNQDLLDISALQTNVQKLQADIHQANEQQEQKHVVINKLLECFEIKRKINEYEKEKEILMNDIQHCRHLPANISEAEKKLNELKKKYKEVSDAFSRQVSSNV